MKHSMSCQIFFTFSHYMDVQLPSSFYTSNSVIFILILQEQQHKTKNNLSELVTR